MTTVTIKLPAAITRKASARGEDLAKVATRLVRDYFADEDAHMPPESRISKKLIAAVKQSERDYKAGRYTECKTAEESTALFQKLWGNE